MTGPLEHAGSAHGPLAVTAHHHRLAGRVLRSARQVAKLDVGRTGDMARDKLGVLPDVQDRAAVHAVGCDQRGALDAPAVCLPGVHAAVQLAGQVLVPDLEGLPGDLGRVLPRGEHKAQGRSVGHQPAQPGGELVAQRDGYRAGNVPGCELGDGPDVNQPAAPVHQETHSGRGERGQLGTGG